ncbi:UNVERIFIED_CONTAM: Chromatin modification-related protein EAF1 A [Sesamum radiatum]|uniref:Chromatin modification-related protein EAF1 A n=1 Tax=Sesamum radiatum TaxID=300843 RepID=A0AAW2W2J2_SESRA
MGRVVEGGVGIANRTSPLKAAIEKVQAELRQEYGVRDERKRELEFLERGGNPLDFKLGNGASVSVQSTSITDLHPDQIVTSEAKGSFAFTASPHGDSVESSDRPRATPCEPNSADNLMLFDAEQEFSEGGRSFLHPSRSTVVPSDQSFHIDGNRKTQEHGDSAAFELPRKAYKRRYRSRPNRDGARSGSTDVNPTRGYHASSIPSRHGPRDVQGLASGTENQHVSLDPKPTGSIDGNLHKTVSGDGQPDMELDGLKSVESTKDLIKDVPVDAALDVIAPRNSHDEQGNQQSLSGAAKTPNQIDSSRTEAIQAIEKINSVIVGGETSATDTVGNQSSSCQINGFSRKKADEKTNDAQNSSAPCSINMLGSESFCTRTSLSIAGKNDIEMCTGTMNVDSNGNLKNPTLQVVAPAIESDNFVKRKKDTAGIDGSTLVNKETDSQIQQENGFRLQPEEESDRDKYAFISEVKNKEVEGVEVGGSTRSESGRKSMDPLVENTEPQIETSYDRRQDSIDVSDSGLHDSRFLPRVSNISIEAQTSSGPDSRFASKIDEDSILKEAQIIEAKRKRIAELSIVTNPAEIHRKSHWDYVLEEMAWLANDFAQERIWKIAAASQISYCVAVTCRLRKQEKGSSMVANTVAHTLAKAVMEFWHAVDTGKELEQQRQKNGGLSVQAYAVRFLKHNKHNVIDDLADVPLTPDRISDSGILDQSYSWEDNLTEENLFYTVPTGAMETYRKSIESLVVKCERNGVTVQEEVETSACDAAAESQENAFDEDEGETSTYNTSVVFEGSKSSRYGQKKRKHLTHAYGARSYEMGSDLLPMHYAENKVVNQQSALLAKRPGGSLNVSIPTKRVRTASRRVIGSFNAGASGFQLPNKTDASSGDTNSFQDDQSTLRGGLVVPNNSEVESAADFERQLPFESAEVSTKPKKKKKAKHLNAEQRWQVDSSFQNEQFPRDHLKKRLDSHQLEYNGTSGLLGQPMIKKPKIMRQSQDNSFDNMPPSGGSVPSPVASQISNMSNPNKFIKMLGGRDRGRKAKAVKMPTGQPGSGSPWSLFEDQALVVLAHDLGPNWELVSDAINSTLHVKCIFRIAKECKERHNFLMDRTSGDGADSAEDSGSSQPYPSTLPGIPKGSARQLFQRLQGPMEEDMLKSHFEKIIMIGQKRHRKTQVSSLNSMYYCRISRCLDMLEQFLLRAHSCFSNDNQDPRQLQQPHSSHTTALSQVCPNNLNGGPILTPLDLCDAAISGPDMLSLGYQGPHSSGLAIPSQGTFTPMLPASGASSVLQGSPNMMIGSNFSSSPGPLNSPASKDARYVVPRSGSVSADEQQRIQPYNQMIPGRNIPQPNISLPGALPGTDRGVRILPGAMAWE